MATPTFTLPTSGSDPRKATKEGLEENINQIIQYLDDMRIRGDAAQTTGLNFQGPWDASTELFPSVNLDGDPVSKGDFFWVSVEATFGGETYLVDEPLVATTDNPSIVDQEDWYHAPVSPSLVPIIDSANTLKSRVDTMPVNFDTVADFFAASLADIKARANATTGTAYVETSDGFGRYSADLAQADDFDDTTTGGVEFTYLETSGAYQGEAFNIPKDGTLATDRWQKALLVAAGKKLVFGAGIFAFSLVTGSLEAEANTHIEGAGPGTIFDVVGDSQGLNLSARHVTFSDFRLRGSASMAADKACLILGEDGDTARSRLSNIVVGGRGGTVAPLESSVVLSGDAIRGDHVFLTNFDSIYAYNARYGCDISKANGASSGLQNANAWSGCEFHNCTWGYRAGRLKGCTFDACTFESNDQHGLIVGFVNGTRFDGIYFESNHSLDVAAVKSDMLVDPAMVGETDPGGGLAVSGWFTKGAFSDYGLYVQKQRGFDISSVNVNAGYLVSGVHVSNDANNSGVIGPANFIPDGITNLSPATVATISGGRTFNYEKVSENGVVSGGTFDLFTPANGDVWDVWITRNSAATAHRWFGIVMRAANGALSITTIDSANISVADASGTIQATNGTGSTQNYFWSATRRTNFA